MSLWSISWCVRWCGCVKNSCVLLLIMCWCFFCSVIVSIGICLLINFMWCVMVLCLKFCWGG